MNPLEECYRLLEVGDGASVQEIRDAYLLLVNVWHPDRFTHDARLQERALAKLKAINDAFQRIKSAPLRPGLPAAAPVDAGVPQAGARPQPAPGDLAVPDRSAAEWFQLGVRLANTSVELKPGETLTWTHISNLTQHQEGMRALEEATRLQPDFVEAWYQLGQARAQFRQYDEAVRAFREVVRLRPVQRGAWINLGAALAQLERYPEVIQAFREALRLDARDASAWYTLGVAYAHPHIHRFPEARDAYREAVRLKPDLAEGWHALGMAYLELCSLGENALEDALAALREAVSLKPDLIDAWLTLGTVLGRAERHDDAIRAYRQALFLRPESVEAWFGFGTSARLLGGPQSGKDVEEAYARLRRLDRQEASRFLELLPRHQRLWLAWRSDR
jgi:cytochrome c-type biogenesis protein CcmH/NrfG